MPGLLPQCLVKRHSSAGTATYSLGRERLFSRQLFYRMPPIDEWADQFEQGDEDMDSLFSDWGRQWKKLVDYLHERVNVIQFHLSDTQKERFNSCFARIFGHAGLSYGYPMRSSVARIAPISAGSLPWWPSCDRWRVSSSHKPFSILNFHSQLSRSLACPRDPGGERTGTVSFLP